MRTFGDVNLGEGSELVNTTVAHGINFPQVPNNGELFFYTGDAQEKGLYIYDTDTWLLIANNKEVITRVETFRPKRLQLTKYESKIGDHPSSRQ